MKVKYQNIFVYILLIALAIVWVFPIISMFTVVTKSPDQFDSLNFWQLPAAKQIPGNIFTNIRSAWTTAEIGGTFLNSLLYAVVAGVGSAFLASLGGFALVHLNIRGPRSWFMGIFIGNIFPFQMFLIPLYIYLNSLGLYDTRIGMIIVYVGICIPFALFVYRNYAFTMPGEVFDAGKVDGASKWAMYLRIFLPMSRPAFAVVFTFQFIWTWNDLLFGLVLSERYRPVMTALSKLQGARGGVPIPILIAGTIVASLPTVIVLLTMQKSFVRGFTITTEK